VFGVVLLFFLQLSIDVRRSQLKREFD